MAKNEKTGKKVASLAGTILRRIDDAEELVVGSRSTDNDVVLTYGVPVCFVKELKSILASALTQTPDKKGK